MRPFTILGLILIACGHEELNFDVPDSGRAHHDPGASDTSTMACMGLAPDCRDLSTVPGIGQGLPSDSARNDGGSAANDEGSSAGTTPGNTDRRGGATDSNAAPQTSYQDDPTGYPTGPGQLAASCAQGQSFEEICANDIDDDCDGTVDEYPGIGEPCRAGCGEGIYVCSAETNSLLCHGPHGCMNPVPASCGDGFVGSDEACDPNAQGEQPGITCTLTCERPLFVRCVDAGAAHPDFCDDLHVCDTHIGACMPVIGPRQPRCPQLPIEGSSAKGEFYPMLETESGECWVTCSADDQCPSSLSECYMGFCAVPF
jgi:hypothetical protein